MTGEQLQFAIAQYADGTLPAGERAALEELLKTDATAQQLLAEERTLSAMLKALPGPEVAWGEMARDFSAVVTGTVDEASRASDQKLNAILKAAGPAPTLNWPALASHISRSIDAEMEAADASDAKLDQFLRGAPLPAINWDRLAAGISAQVAQEAEKQSAEKQVVYRVSWVRTVSRMAVAACVALVAGLGIRAYVNRPGPIDGPAPGGNAVSFVEAVKPEAAEGSAVAEVKIGPSAAYVARNSDEGTFAARAPMVIALPARRADEFERAGMFE